MDVGRRAGHGGPEARHARLELSARIRLARLLADEPKLAAQLVKLAEREGHVLPAVREAVKEFSTDTFRLRQAVQAIAEGYQGPARQAWMHGVHPDALAAIQRATPAELEEIAAMMRGARNRADAEEILRQLTYKAAKAERKGGAAFQGVADAASRLRSGLAELATVRARGYPIDVALLADATKFDSLAKQFIEVANSAGNTKLAKTIAKEAASGKIPYVRFAPREAGFEFGRVVRAAAGEKSVQVSLIKRGSEFDLGPFLPVP